MEKSHPLLVNLTRCPSAQSVILMNAKMIYSLEHILVSVSTCLLRRKFQSKMKTRAFETEVIYNMSPSTNISASLRAFGLTDTTKDVVCLFVNIDDADAIGEFLGLVQGQVDVLDHISRVNEVSEIAKVSPSGSLLFCVLTV
ncbi:hypothetical protein OIY81_3337 [Cryptosporidium canis]|uniref:EKC/KEOPS complex subunit cgi121 n=1 Tax=Cryptosporidium canis TaxID=195482 RepID=A0ABQ8P2T1_9CRYT|nr:hypothetical protein OIY81_3337 [Cryptosporidium canis]KAJ1606098.1 hypothetical protein OJ252_3284 [Cryptosporidium canis]